MSRRSERLAGEIRAEVARIVASELKDPRLGFVTVTRVELTSDLRYARVFVGALGEEGDACDELQILECDVGLECIEGQCSPLGDTGATCTEYWDCRGGLNCIEGKCGTLNCQPAKDGETCLYEFFQCDKDSYCSDITGTCAPYKQRGNYCYDDPDSCDVDLYCDYQTESCRPLKENGLPCEDGDECESTYCDENDEICIETPSCRV